MDPIAADARKASGHGLLTGMGVAREVSQALRYHFAPGVPAVIYQDVVRCPQLQRTEQTVGKNMVECDLLRRRAEARMAGGASPGAYVIAVERGVPEGGLRPKTSYQRCTNVF